MFFKHLFKCFVHVECIVIGIFWCIGQGVNAPRSLVNLKKKLIFLNKLTLCSWIGIWKIIDYSCSVVGYRRFHPSGPPFNWKLDNPRFTLKRWALGLWFSCHQWKPMMDSIHLTYPVPTNAKAKNQIAARRYTSDVIVTLKCRCPVNLGSQFLALFKESIICVRMGYENSSLLITLCHHSASLMTPPDDHRDRIFYPALTLMINSFIIYLQWNTFDTTTFPTRKFKILYHATRVIFFRITILHVLPNSQDKSLHLAANS